MNTYDTDTTFLQRHAPAVATAILAAWAALAIGHVQHSLFAVVAAAMRLAS